MEGLPELRRIRHLVSSRGGEERIRDELEEELAFHRRRTVEELVGRGMGWREAEREAARRFGDAGVYRAELARIDRSRARREGRMRTMETVRQGVGFALRGARRRPGFTAVVVATLTLGIGANSVVFGVIDRLLLSPPEHVTDPDRVMRVYVDRASPFTGQPEVSTNMTWPDVVDFQEVDAFESVGAWGRQTMTMGSGQDAARVHVELATASYFPTLGVRPHLGRFFGPEEDRFGGSPVAVLSHGFWTRSFGADPDILGREISLGEHRYPVVGVAPANFTGVGLSQVDVWLPLRSTAARTMGEGWTDSRRWYFLAAVARVREGVDPERAGDQATAAHRAGREEEVDLGRYDESARVVLGSLIPGRGVEPGREVAIARWLGGLSIFVLLIACANVANLLLARAVRWRRELAVRVALGVGRGRLLASLVGESLLLALLGAAGALIAAVWGGRLLYRILLPGIDPGNTLTSPRLFLFTGGVALFTVLLAGLPPALRASRTDPSVDLKAGRRGDPSEHRLRAVLLVAQVALSVTLLVGAGLFVRSLERAHGVELGFRPEGLIIASAEMEEHGRWSDGSSRAVVAAAERLEGAPGVEAVAVAGIGPMMGLWGMSVRTPERDSVPFARGGPFVFTVSPDYHRVVGIPILRGRAFTEADDREGAPPVAIVTRDMARALFGEEEPLGRCILVSDEPEDPAPCTRVVGVSADVHTEALEETESPVYFITSAHPAAADLFTAQMLLVRSAGDPGETLETVREATLAAIPGVRYVDVSEATDRIDDLTRAWRLGGTLFGIFGLLAAVVASLGVYSLVAFDVAERRPELGVRAALGASRTRLVGRVLLRSQARATLGVLAGLAVALALSGYAGNLLFQVSPTDPLVYAGSAVLMLVVAGLAAAVPARSVARLDPAEALWIE